MASDKHSVDSKSKDPKSKEHHHFVLPDKTAYMTFGALIVLTVITVALAQVNLGVLNFPIAFLVASVKALLVCMFFMVLKYDKRENSVIFGTSFVFLFIFITLTSLDLLFRGDVYVKKGDAAAAMASSASSAPKFKRPWISTPELIARGKEQYGGLCASCHGDAGLGNGLAAAAYASQGKPPRNFTVGDGWKNGRKPSQVYQTLKVGLNNVMPAFESNASPEDRWALSHYILSLGPTPPQDVAGDLAKVGVDASKEYMGAVAAPSIPVDFAIERLAAEAAGK